MSDQAAILPLSAEPSLAQRVRQWIWVNVARPIGQIFIFVLVGAIIMTILAYAVAFISNALKLGKPGLDMVNIVNIQSMESRSAFCMRSSRSATQWSMGCCASSISRIRKSSWLARLWAMKC
jgi:hypothetical protein